LELKNKVKNRIDSYIGLDSDLIFSCGDPIIFGGCVRDSISDMEIHDVDILCGPETEKKIIYLLHKHGYSHLEQLTPKDLSRIYTDIKIISEPRTYHNNGKYIQIIKPVSKLEMKFGTIGDLRYKDIIYDLVNNVDISCCGVCYNGKNIIEQVEDAVLHCLSKVFVVNHSAKMKTSSRLPHRQNKLEKRGWREIQGKIDRRDILIDKILDTKLENFDYIKYVSKKIM
jgi:hypothetical protein